MKAMSRNLLGIAILGFIVLFVMEHYSRSKQGTAPVNTGSTNAASTSTNNPYIQAALSNALVRVRADLAAATNADEIARLRVSEQQLTNAMK